jgi:hypothetical protein
MLPVYIDPMRTPFLLLLLTVTPAAGQTPQAFIASLYDETAGAYKVVPDGPPGLRATSGAARALTYLGEPIPHKERLVKFVLGCYDAKTGAFAEPGGKPDVTITSVGVLACHALEIDFKSIAKSMDYLKANAKSFEDVRIGAAAVELWKDRMKSEPFDLEPWFKIGEAYRLSPEFKDGGARSLGSYAAFRLRLGRAIDDPNGTAKKLLAMQDAAGGWGDLETTYRVMRALKHLKAKPDTAKLEAYLKSHRNADGGSATKLGEKSSMSGTYYVTAVMMWAK